MGDWNDLLRDALAGYSSVPPPVGFEQRVLNRIRIKPRPALRWWIPVIAAAGCAVAAGLMVSVAPRPVRLPVIPAVVVATATESHPAPVRPAAHHTRPRRDVFPSPTPLTDEERALLALAAGEPGEAAAALTYPEPAGIADLAIEEIAIPALGE